MWPKLSQKEKERRIKLLEECAHSDLSIAQWCRKNNLNYKQFLAWKSLAAIPIAEKFVELKDEAQKNECLILSYKNITVQLHRGFDKEVLKSFLDVILQC